MLKDLSLTDLKALAYDLISQMEAAQSQLQTVNGEIAKRLKEQQAAAVADVNIPEEAKPAKEQAAPVKK